MVSTVKFSIVTFFFYGLSNKPRRNGCYVLNFYGLCHKVFLHLYWDEINLSTENWMSLATSDSTF